MRGPLPAEWKFIENIGKILATRKLPLLERSFKDKENQVKMVASHSVGNHGNKV